MSSLRFPTFDLERFQSLWEHEVDVNLSESGVHPVSLRELTDLGFDLEGAMDTPLMYIQTNGSKELRTALGDLYPGATPAHIEITNGTAEANYVLAQVLIEPGDEVVFEMPNYIQLAGIAEALGAEVRTFSLQFDQAWRPDLEALADAVTSKTKLIYVSHPNNPSGYVLSDEEIDQILDIASGVGAWVLADEVYRGAEHSGEISPSFWGRYERCVVTSGLSKAFGIPGARIGWVVGPPDVVADCWHVHDYTTIAPGAFSDLMAQFAVRDGIRQQLYARGRSFMGTNRALFEEWLSSNQEVFGGWHPPQAGAYAFVPYNRAEPSADLVERVRVEQSVLLVAGVWTGMEGFLRFGLGGPAELFREGLERLSRALS